MMKLVQFLFQLLFVGFIVSTPTSGKIEKRSENRTTEDAPIMIISVLGRKKETFGFKRMHNGRDVTIEDFPYLVQIGEVGDEDAICSGVIIGKYWALSAAQCFVWHLFNPEKYFLRSGTSSRDGKGGKVHALKKIETHMFSNQNSEAKNYDVVILTLNQPFEYSDVCQKLPIAIEPPKTNDTAVVVGWGATEVNSTVDPRVLQAANVSMLNNYDCFTQTKWGKRIGEDHICAEGTSIARKGDLGTPLVSNDKIFGINSFGKQEYEEGYPTVFISMASLYNFLRISFYGTDNCDVDFV